MASNIYHVLPNGCQDFKNTATMICLPRKVKCNNTIIDGIILSDASGQCQIVCNNNIGYKIPVPADALWQLQVNFIDQQSADYKNPTTGWGDWINIAPKDGNGNTITVVDPITSKAVNGYDGSQNYQTIEVDMANIPATCFYLQVSAGPTSVVTQAFEKETCLPLIELEAIKDFGKDCHNNYYGKTQNTADGDDFSFTPKAYLRGTVRYKGANLGTKKEIVSLIPSELIPDWYAKYIINKIFSGSKVKINGVTYDTPDVTIQSTRSQKFNLQIDFEKNCNDQNSNGELCS